MSDPMPVPFLKTFLTVAVKVLEACQEASAIEENVKELQGRVYNLMLVVINSVPMKEKASVELRERIERLQRVLAGILTDLGKIKEQRKSLLVFFRDLNKGRVDKCVGRLNEALEEFRLASQLRVEASQLRVEDLLAKIKAEHSTVIPQLTRIEDAVKQFSQPHNATTRREDMRLLPPVFLGRDTLVQKIALLLAAEGTSRVCITGIGGMGKTSVAVAVTESSIIRNIFPKEYIFWVPCITAKSSDLLRRILYTQLRITAETYDSLDLLIAELDESKRPRLLLLDNFETPWLSGPDPLEVGHILRRLAALPHIALLITTTSGVTPGGIKWEHVPLPALEPTAARDAFKSTYQDAGDGLELAAEESLDVVLESIGHIPLAITLMATYGGHLGASLDDLVVDWKEAGTEMLSGGGKGSLSMDHTIGLSMERGVSTDPNALKLLAILSMLPAGTTGSNLEWWAPALTSFQRHAAVKTLRTAALIEQDHGPFATSRIFVRPTIQSYMSHQDRISADVRSQVHDACYDFVLRHKSIPDDHKFKSDLEALSSEETNIQGLLMEIPVDAPRPNAVDALIAFGLYQSWTKPSTVVATHALKVARAVLDDPHISDRDPATRRVAAAYQCLGTSLLRLDRYDEACTHFEEAIARFKGLLGGADLHCAGEASMELLQTWIYVGTKSRSARESLAREAQANLSHDKTSNITSPAVYSHLDTSSGRMHMLARELTNFMRRSPLPKPYSSICVVQQALPNAFIIWRDSMLSKAAILKPSPSSGMRWRKPNFLARPAYEEAAAICTRLLPLCQAIGTPLGIAQDLELLAYNCVAMMDLPGARVAYQDALIQFIKIKSTWIGNDGVERCSENLRRLESMTEMDQVNFSELIRPDPMY
ncbi:hypothetical protein C8R45DRAFT_379197 [Mycena sanguinolenta]|nr:hypothetical protein C8R45DRAFT_379197 [Mycena sanguinolenta]